MTTAFPFPALVGQDDLKVALQLAAIDRRLSVLARGDKGAGKSTAARRLVDLLPQGTPFVNLPIGATDDRLLGGLDVEKALKGEPALRTGLLGEAHGGVLYIDEVNLLPDHLADALLDAVASGVHVIEREGFSAAQPAEFVLVGSMNPEEGALRPQLLDRFALAVDVTAPMDPSVRCDVIERRLAYDADPNAFIEAWRDRQADLSQQLARARAALSDVRLPHEILTLIAERVIAHGVRSLRADLAIIRGSRALAAWRGADTVEAAHVDVVLPLALAHRLRGRPSQSPPPPAPQSRPAPDESQRDRANDTAVSDRVFAPADVIAPRLLISHQDRRLADGSAAQSDDGRPGAAIGARRSTNPEELDPRATLLRAATRGGVIHVRPDDLHERVREQRTGSRYVFVVDSSGSHAIHERMAVVKGAIGGILDRTQSRHDEVVVIACRGAAAQVLLEPTTDLDDVRRALECLPTGGRTPLAHALSLASLYVTGHAALVVVTDGHANVPDRTDDPWADTLAAAATITGPGLVIDSEDPRDATGRPRVLADAMGARYVHLAALGETPLLTLLRDSA